MVISSLVNECVPQIFGLITGVGCFCYSFSTIFLKIKVQFLFGGVYEAHIEAAVLVKSPS